MLAGGLGGVEFAFTRYARMLADIGLNRMMGVVGYGFLPTSLSTLLALLVMYLKPPEDFDIRNPLAFNVGAFIPSDSAQWMKGLASSIDVFSFWIMALMAVGVSAASRKMSFGKALAVIMLPWALYVLLKTSYLVMVG